MWNKDILVENFLKVGELESKAIREGFGDEITRLGAENQDIWIVNADLEGSLKVAEFKNRFPERFVQVGVAEQAMAGVGTGLALYGKVPFITSFAAFSPGLNWSQIRLAAMSEANIKIVGSHYGVNVGEDGASAQMLSDIALMRVLPNMHVLSPADYHQAKAAVDYMAHQNGPMYLRVTRSKFPVFTRSTRAFEPTQVLHSGKDVTIVATGSVVYETIQATQLLLDQGIKPELINLAQIKPLVIEPIAMSVDRTKKLIVVEEHQAAAGAGSAVLEALHAAGGNDFEYKHIAMNDKFGESGDGMELMRKYGFHRDNIAKIAQEI